MIDVDCPARAHPQVAGDPEIVGDVPHAPDRSGKILRPPPRRAVLDRAGERHLARLDLDLDATGVEAGIVHQPVADELEQARVGAGLVLRPAAAMRAGDAARGPVALGMARAVGLAECRAVAPHPVVLLLDHGPLPLVDGTPRLSIRHGLSSSSSRASPQPRGKRRVPA